jgi:hypothetical protein
MYISRDVTRRRDPGYAHIELSSDGTIGQVQFRQMRPAATRPAQATAVAAPREAGVGT